MYRSKHLLEDTWLKTSGGVPEQTLFGRHPVEASGCTNSNIWGKDVFEHDGYLRPTNTWAFLAERRGFMAMKNSKTIGPAPRRGRPRKHASNSSRQKAYRERLKERNPAAPTRSTSLKDWNLYLAAHGLSVNQGLYLEGAPQGCGRLTSGGYDSEHIGYVIAAHDEAESGRRVPTGGSYQWGHEVDAYVPRTADFGEIEQQAYDELIALEQQLRETEIAKSVTKVIVIGPRKVCKSRHVIDIPKKAA